MSSTLRIVVGQDTDAIGIAVTDSNGSAVDLSGKTLSAQIVHDGGTISVTISNQDLVNGTFDVSMNETETAQIPLGKLSVLKIDSVEGATSLNEICINVLGVTCL